MKSPDYSGLQVKETPDYSDLQIARDVDEGDDSDDEIDSDDEEYDVNFSGEDYVVGSLDDSFAEGFDFNNADGSGCTLAGGAANPAAMLLMLLALTPIAILRRR